MFQPDIPAMKAHAALFENHWNALAASAFLGKAQQWALQQKVDLGPPPVAPFRKLFTLDEETFQIVESFSTTERVSDVDPKMFLPKYGTNVDAIGGPVGGPIKGAPGKFHIAAGAFPNSGDKYTAADGRQFVHVRSNQLVGYWEEIG